MKGNHRALLVAVALGYLVGVSPSGAAVTVTVAPEHVMTDHTTPRSLIRVTVLDAAGQPLAWQPVDFETADPQQAAFHASQAFTNGDGLAVNVLVRRRDPVGLATSFTVRFGPRVAGPFPIDGTNTIADGQPFGFFASPLAPFDGPTQRLLGRTGGFQPLALGTRVAAWSIDPRLAEPGIGTITSAQDGGGQDLEFGVSGHREGDTTFVLDTLDVALFEAAIRGGFAPCACDDGDPCTANVCAPQAGCLFPPRDCDDGDMCDGEESCIPAVGCALGAAPPCVDSGSCVPEAVLCSATNMREVLAELLPSSCTRAACRCDVVEQLLTTIERRIARGIATPNRCARALRGVAGKARALDRRVQKLVKRDCVASLALGQRLATEAARLRQRAALLARGFCS